MNEVLISTKSLGKTYILSSEVSVCALKNIDLSILKGEFVAIMGASGSGKSTLLNLLGCLDTPSEGEYYLEEVRINALAPLAKIRREKIGFIFQSFNLIPQLTAVQNVETPMIYSGYAAAERMMKASELLERVGLGDRMYHHPKELSGGQKQRVAIARSLANDPPLIIADEPTGNLDSKTGEAIMNLLNELNDQGKTIVMVTHEEEISKHAHRIIRLKDGEILSN